MSIKLLSIILAGCISAPFASSCHTNQTAAEASEGSASANSSDEDEPPTAAPDADVIIGSPVRRPAAVLPSAVVYRTNIDVYDRVPVVVTPDGKGLVTYPAPGDITDSQLPVRLDDGWLLNRRIAIGPQTRFLRYSYAEYAALPQAPATAELLAAIIPDARVTAAYRLPMTLNAALADTAAVNTAIHANFPSATPLLP